MELGKRLNLLREQFGREQAASLEETYKQSWEEGGSEAKKNNTQSASKKVINTSIQDAEEQKKSKNKDYDLSENNIKKEASTSEPYPAVTGAPAKAADLVGQEEGESQYPLPDSGVSGRNSTLVFDQDTSGMDTNRTFTGFIKKAKNNWKKVDNTRERKLKTKLRNLQVKSTQPVIPKAINQSNEAQSKEDQNTDSDIELNIAKGEQMLQYLGTSRKLRKKLPLRTKV